MPPRRRNDKPRADFLPSTLSTALGTLGGKQPAWMTGGAVPPAGSTAPDSRTATITQPEARITSAPSASAAPASQPSSQQERIDSPSEPANAPPTDTAGVASSQTPRPAQVPTWIDLTLAPSLSPVPALAPAPALVDVVDLVASPTRHPAPAAPPLPPPLPTRSAVHIPPAGAHQAHTGVPNASLEEQLFQAANVNAPREQATTHMVPMQQGRRVEGAGNAYQPLQLLPASRTDPQDVAMVDASFLQRQPHLPSQTGPEVQNQPGTHMAPSNSTHARPFQLKARQADASFPQTTTAPPAAPTMPVPFRDRAHCLRILEQVWKQYAIGKANNDNIRWHWVKEAVRRGDFEFVAFHQRYCWLCVAPRKDIPNKLRQAGILIRGTGMLDTVLRSNVSLSKKTLEFFANWPMHILEQQKQYPRICEEDHAKYIKFANLALQWRERLEIWRTRRCPPLPMELVHEFQIESALLQDCMFSVVWREITGNLNPNQPREREAINTILGEARQWRRPPVDEYAQFAPRIQQLVMLELASTQWPVTQVNNLASSMQVTAQYPGHALLPGPGHPSTGFRILGPRQPIQNGQPGLAIQQVPTQVRGTSTVIQSSASQVQTRSSRAQPAPAHTQPSLPIEVQQPAETDLFRELHPLPPVNLRLLPPLDHRGQTLREANPGWTALHEHDKRCPRLRPPLLKEIPWQYINSFAREPARLPITSGLVTWTLTFSAEELARRPNDVDSQDGGPPERHFNERSHAWQLRSIRKRLQKKEKEDDPPIPDPHLPDKHEWHKAHTEWHPFVTLQINGHFLSPRLKHHWGKNFPVDLTPHLKEGENKLVIGTVRTRNDPSYRDYIYAVETVGFEDDSGIHARIMGTHLSHSAVRDEIKRRLTQDDDTQNDDDIAIIEDSLTINVRDAISLYCIPEVPVRSTQCMHFECFDLDVFLTSRKKFADSGISHSDTWLCPVCFADARPPLLAVDKFMESVLEELKRRGLEKETTAITVVKDGSWKVKEEASGGRGVEGSDDGGDTDEVEVWVGNMPAVASRVKTEETEIEVIELSD